MEKLFLTLVLFWFSVCSFAEDYSFSVIKSGIGKKSVIFIPGFASSGDVWKEAVAELGTHYTCYVLTMAGFAGVPPEKNPSFEGTVWEADWHLLLQQTFPHSLERLS